MKTIIVILKPDKNSGVVLIIKNICNLPIKNYFLIVANLGFRQNSGGGISDFWISGQSSIKKNCITPEPAVILA